ncbi:MAG: DUF6531 domain-containing protein [Desulfuromonadaceae bacterium]|nr:DUF6531 domain-containing protein [Desulfuromonadaceae bacterium]MDD2849641.1 DUF6531 domain-containing protein [Desulfuromonadaceae bacterium]MDD4131687.1 DUF6531 domain-containing protein [Desulfuromonadaceae bacterium]
MHISTTHIRRIIPAVILAVLALSVAQPSGAQDVRSAVSARYSSAQSSSVVASDDDIVPLRPGLSPDKRISVVTGSSVDIGNGTYTFAETDLRVPAKGIPITMERTYRSNQIMKSQDDSSWHFAIPAENPLGYGWHSPWFVRVGTDGTYLDGQGNYIAFERDANGAYLPNASAGLTLIKTTTGFELRKNGDTTSIFDNDGWLRKINDNAGNSVTITYGTNGKPATVTDVTGRTVLTFSYTTRGFLESVRDIAGRIVTYEHDTIDNLTKATLTLPAGASVVLGTYTYDLTDYGKIPMVCSYSTRYVGGVKITTMSCLSQEPDPADQFGTVCKTKEWYVDGIRYTESYCYAPQYQNNYHNLIGKTDAEGETYTIDYIPKWRNKGIARSVTDTNGRSTTFTYSFTSGDFTYSDYDGRKYRKILNDKGQLVYYAEIVPGANGESEQLIKKIDYLDGRVEATTDALGNVTQEQKDEWGNVIKRTDADGNSWRYQYDSFRQLITVTDPLNTSTRYEYDQNGNRIKEIIASGTTDESVTTYTYGRYKELVTTTSYGAITTYEYDDAGNLNRITDPNDNITTMTYDGAGNLTSRTVPLIGTTTYAGHDWKGNPKAITDPNQTVTTNTYDTAGRILTTTTDNAATTYTYVTTGGTSCTSCSAGGNGKIASITLPEGNRIYYNYDTNGNLATISDQDGNYIQYSYDGKGNKIKEEIKDASGTLHKTQSHQYDILNRLNKTINPDQGETTHSYDKRGNRVNLTNPNANSTGYSYDQVNRLIKVTQPGNITTGYTYDKRNNLTSVTDANGNTTSYEYDKQNRLIKTTSPDTGITTYSYDKNGNLKTKTDAKQVTATYTYDATNRLTKIEFPDPIDNVTYAYDTCPNGKGRLCTMIDLSGSTTYEYTTKGQIKKETRTIDSSTFITEYGYDKNGNITTMKYPSGRIITYTYANDRVTGILNNGTAIASSISYKPFGGPSAMTFGNGIQQTNNYDLQYRLTSLAAQGVQDLAYGFDRNGNITSITDNLDATKTKSYGYDPLDRLTNAIGPWGSLVYSYDGVGNRKTENHNEITTNYGYKVNSNQLVSASGQKNFSFGFDQNGNTNLENNKSYIYNQNRRLITVIEETTTHNEHGEDVPVSTINGEYVYNGNGLRVKKTARGQKTYFVFALQGKLIMESGVTNAEYVFLNGGAFAKLEGQTLYYIHADHLGTPQKMTDSQNQIIWEISEMPFGETIGITGAATNNFRFPGQYYDNDLKMNYNMYRYYNYNSGRYIESERLLKKYLVFDMYPYALNNPLKYKDFWGLDGSREYGGGFGVALGVVGVSISVSTKQCCDESNVKHSLTIQSVCLGIELGLGIEEAKGSSSGVSDKLPVKSCPNMFDQSGYYEEKPVEAWGAIVVGRYGNTDGERGWRFGFGGGISLYSGCRNDIIKNYVIGKCCK